MCWMWFKVAINNQIFAEWREAHCMSHVNGFRIKAIMRERETVSNIMQQCQWKKLGYTFKKYIFAIFTFPFPTSKRKAPKCLNSNGLKTESVGGEFPAEHIVVLADLFNSSDGNLPLSSTPLNKLKTDQVLLQKYQELKNSQWGQAPRPVHWQHGESFNKRGWETGSKGPDLQWALGSKEVHTIVQVRIYKREHFPSCHLQHSRGGCGSKSRTEKQLRWGKK